MDERRRVALRHQIAATWGEEAADILFELITPAGQDPATRQDLAVGLEQVERRFEQVDRRFEQVDRRFEQVDRRFTALEDQIDHRFAVQDQQLDARFAALGERFERRIADAVTSQTRTLVLSQLVALVTIAGLAFGLQ